MTNRKRKAAPSASPSAGAVAVAEEEPVLLIPPQLTQSAYALLVKHGLVPRKFHLEGRYGSRTFRPSDHANDKISAPAAQRHKKVENDEPTIDRRMGLPLLQSAVTMNGDLATIATDAEELQTLLATPGVEVVRLQVPHPKNAPKPEHVDATAHPDRAPASPPICRRIHRPILQVSDADASRTAPAFTFMELFSGIGGFGLALEALGGQCMFASEINANCNRIYMTNMAHPPKNGVHGDIYKVPDGAFPSKGTCDLLVAGFPCQPFSRLGAQPGFDDGDRGMLYTQIVRALRVSRPRAFLLENVPGLAAMGDSLSEILASLDECGYEVTTEVVTARGLTVQSRKRLFFVGMLRSDGDAGSSKSFEFPYVPDLALRAQDVIEYAETDGDEFSRYRLSPVQMEQLLNRSKRWKPAKLAWPDTTLDVLDGHYGVTISKGNSQLVPGAAPANPRVFTPRECARVMGFPHWFDIPETTMREDDETSRREDGKKSSATANDNKEIDHEIVAERSHRKRLYLMFGNTVCPPLIAVLAGAILAEAMIDKSDGNNINWRSRGLEVAVSLSLESVLESRRGALVQRLEESNIISERL